AEQDVGPRSHRSRTKIAIDRLRPFGYRARTKLLASGPPALPSAPAAAVSECGTFMSRGRAQGTGRSLPKVVRVGDPLRALRDPNGEKGRGDQMTAGYRTARRTTVALAAVRLFGAALLLGGCAGQTETVSMQQPGGPPQQMTIPKATITGAASGAQAHALAQAIVDANNNTMKQFDAEGGRLDKLQAAENKDYQTAQQTLSRLEQLSNEQGTGQITLFFKTGSVELDSMQSNRLVN